MFFLKMISRSFSRQFKRRLLIAVTVCLSATVSVAMLGVVFDVGDKLNAELSTYGSNIVVQPKSDAVVSDLYNTGDSAGSASGSSSGSDGGSTSDGSAAADSADPTAFLKESDAQKIKTIFWAFNITNFAPELNIHADAGCVGSGAGSAGSAGTAGASGAAASAAKCKATNVPIVGTWFAKTLHMDSGESTVAGMNGMRSWWKINGTWPKDDSEQAMVGSALAAKLGVNVGDSVTLDKTIAVGADDNTNGGTGKTGKSSTERNRVKVKIVGIFDSGDSDNSAIYMPSIAAQTLANLPNSIDKIEVKALTTPDNDLARKATISVSEERAAGRHRDYSARNLTDGRADTYWATDDGTTSATITLTWDKPTTVRYVQLMEHIRLGQRVRAFSIETSDDGTRFTPRATGIATTTIGYKRIIPLNGSTAHSYDDGFKVRALRVKINDSKACPLIQSLAVF